MNRNELVQIAHGLKAARPTKQASDDNWYRWELCVMRVANALELHDKPRSNFLAVCGLLHVNENPTEPGEVQS